MSKIEELEVKAEMAENYTRTCHMMMIASAERLSCMTSAMRYAKAGKESYDLMQEIRLEIKILRDLQDDVTKTEAVVLPLIDDKEALKRKLELLKELYNTGKIDKKILDFSIRKVKREFYGLKLAA